MMERVRRRAARFARECSRSSPPVLLPHLFFSLPTTTSGTMSHVYRARKSSSGSVSASDAPSETSDEVAGRSTAPPPLPEKRPPHSPPDERRPPERVGRSSES